MKLQQLFFTALLLGSGLTSPTSDNKCTKYQYNPPVCPYCPYNSSPYVRRDEDSLLERGNQGHCQKQCPKDQTQCKKYGLDHKHPEYYLDYEKVIYCGKYSYKVIVKIEQCSWNPKEECLSVYYISLNGNKGNQKCYLGVYKDKNSKAHMPDNLNYNPYCNGNKCSVALEKLPGYPNLCGQKLWVGVDNSLCYNGGHPPKHGRYDLKYISVQIKCKNKKVCEKYCCCPH